jgi:nucleoside-diphosphate-sugar epimerase
MTKILITGAFGQIGTELTPALRDRHGSDAVVATGRHLPRDAMISDTLGPIERLDVTDEAAVANIVERHNIDTIYHLAAVLSARGERDPESTWQINMGGLRNVLESVRQKAGCRVFWPSSVAAFGPETPRDQTPQDTVMRPTTIYGISKVAGELLGDYYFHRYGVDVRGVRYPGVISSGSPPGGGTTDYAVEMFYAALTEGRYTSFVREDCVLPMVYMPDCIAAAVKLMDADLHTLSHHNGYNIASMSFSVGELAEEIKKHIPEFICEYAPDERQAIADTWPRSIDDRVAREVWGWRPQYDLARMTVDMLDELRRRQEAGRL